MKDGFFWLHIKKSAGQSTRGALGPLYTETKRRLAVSDIHDLPVAEWNDGLNNYRMPLGRYQFHRTEYARRFLWPEDWDGMMRIAFAREPVDRCLSMFSYLFGKHWGDYLIYLQHCKAIPLHRRLVWSTASRFDAFLDMLEWQSPLRGGPDPSAPINLHFSTHTNPMSLDVLDEKGKSNLSHLIRLTSFEAGIDFCYAEMGVQRPHISRGIRRNSGGSSGRFVPSSLQRKRIESLFAADFDLFENALHF